MGGRDGLVGLPREGAGIAPHNGCGMGGDPYRLVYSKVDIEVFIRGYVA